MFAFLFRCSLFFLCFAFPSRETFFFGSCNLLFSHKYKIYGVFLSSLWKSQNLFATNRARSVAIYIYTYICTRTRLPENQLSLVMHSLSQSHISCCHCQCIKCRLKMLECAELPSKRLIVCQLKVLKMKKDGEEPRNKKKNKKNKSEPSKHWNLIEISISYGHNGKKHLPNGFIRTANLQHLQLAFHWHKYILAGLNLIWINMYVCARWWFHIRMLTSYFVAHSYLCIHIYTKYMCTYLSHTHT